MTTGSLKQQVAVLFARKDSVYKTLPDCDVWDIERNALNWPGGCPVIAHPPCRAWGQLRHFAKPKEGERELAIWSVKQVRKWGGVLEHPAKSTLWPDLNLPIKHQRDEYGGFSVWISQHWFGHKAEKSTLLYIVGIEPNELPPIPFVLGESTHVIASTCSRRPETTKAEREHTPIALAEWLRNVALKTEVSPR